MHLDVRVDDMAAAAQQVRDIGGELIDDTSETFWVFLDPEGHPFCLVAM
jgi:predicted enzyme related to lactoylglutathione lyase